MLWANKNFKIDIKHLSMNLFVDFSSVDNFSLNYFLWTVYFLSEHAMRSAAANAALHATPAAGRPRAGSFSKKGLDRASSLRIDTSGGQMHGGGSFRANNVTGNNVDQLR
jgi:hypothetical protein